jgi:hypothetical protein
MPVICPQCQAACEGDPFTCPHCQAPFFPAAEATKRHLQEAMAGDRADRAVVTGLGIGLLVDVLAFTIYITLDDTPGPLVVGAFLVLGCMAGVAGGVAWGIMRNLRRARNYHADRKAPPQRPEELRPWG